MGMRGGRGGRGGASSMMSGGGLTSPLRGGRGRGAVGRGGVGRGSVGGTRGTAMKRKAADTFSMASEAKKMAMGGASSWSDDSWATQPIAQQPLGDAEWYQDTW